VTAGFAAPAGFTPAHRGGDGPPLVLLHGFTDTWRTWELVLPMLERHHDVLAPTLAGHAGGPVLGDDASAEAVLDAIERAMDDAGFATAHIAGNSLGGHLALRLAERGRARSVVALAPAGGWAPDDPAPREVLAHFARMRELVHGVAPHADALAATAHGRRQATRFITVAYEHIPAGLVAHLTRGVAACDGAEALMAHAATAGWPVDPERVTCPVRVVWGTEDRLLPWPSAAARYRTEWLPHADWVELEGVGHAPQLDVPLEAAQLILGFTASVEPPR
jgi:pimeloyl-ACP methyl ester carboxylesterase